MCASPPCRHTNRNASTRKRCRRARLRIPNQVRRVSSFKRSTVCTLPWQVARAVSARHHPAHTLACRIFSARGAYRYVEWTGWSPEHAAVQSIPSQKRTALGLGSNHASEASPGLSRIPSWRLAAHQTQRGTGLVSAREQLGLRRLILQHYRSSNVQLQMPSVCSCCTEHATIIYQLAPRPPLLSTIYMR